MLCVCATEVATSATAADSSTLDLNSRKCCILFRFCVRATRRTSHAAGNLLTHACVCVCVCIIVATFVYAPIAESNMWAA